ncbi:MAG: hypothetical protein ACJARR_001104 [Pseudophaeobacter arcticus]|jgi:hypothetical protein
MFSRPQKAWLLRATLALLLPKTARKSKPGGEPPKNNDLQQQIPEAPTGSPLGK